MESDYADLYSQYTKMTNNVELDSSNGVLHYQTDTKPIGLQPELETNSTEQSFEQSETKPDSAVQASQDISQDLSLCYDNDVSNVLTENNTELAANVLRSKEDTSMDVDCPPVTKSKPKIDADEQPVLKECDAKIDDKPPVVIPKIRERPIRESKPTRKIIEKTKPQIIETRKKEKTHATKETSVKNVCRVCMDTGILISIFDNRETVRMCDKVMSCAAVEVAENDGLPGFICKLCASDLEIAYKFKSRCEVSDKRLREKLGLKTKTIVKTEFVLIDCEPVVSDDDKNHKDDYGADYSDPDSDDPSYGSTKRKKLKRKSKMSSKTKKKLKKEVPNDSDDDVILVTKKEPKKNKKGESIIGKYPCTYCEKSFPYPSVLKLHLVTHTKEKTHKCSICSMAFMYSKDLYSHYKDAHPNEYGKVDDSGKYKCKYCDKTFGHMKNLKVHEVVHSRDKKYKCEACPQGFTNMTSLNLHKKQDHPGINKPFRCKVCDKRFKHQPALEKHEENHKQKPVELKVAEEKKPTSTKDLFKTIAPLTTTYWSDSFSD